MPQNVAFITGITGQDGSYLADLLLEKAKAKLGWIPKITVEEMAKEMVENDLKDTRIDKMPQEKN